MSLYWRVLIFRALMIGFTLWLTVQLSIDGYDFYSTPLEERFYHPHYKLLHAAGFWGHGFGIIGTLLITIGVFGYIYAKKTGLRGNYAFNVASIFGFASVIMTYFGVNYYLSGLHSYAAGDPVPIPTWVYISVVMIAFISIWAHFGKRILDRSKNS